MLVHRSCPSCNFKGLNQWTLPFSSKAYPRTCTACGKRFCLGAAGSLLSLALLAVPWLFISLPLLLVSNQVFIALLVAGLSYASVTLLVMRFCGLEEVPPISLPKNRRLERALGVLSVLALALLSAYMAIRFL